MQINREELIARMMQILPKDGKLEILPGLFIVRTSQPTEWVHSVLKPVFCIIAQGQKQLGLGEECFPYDPGHYVISTVTLPVVSKVVKASQERPYLGLVLELNASLVASVLLESEIQNKKGDARVKAMNVSVLDPDLLDAVVRAVRLVSNPDEIPVIAPLTIREIIYRLSKREQGARLGHLLHLEGNTHRISKAVEYIREHFSQPLRIEELAHEFGMSVSGFHHHFKSVTTMSPLQFQKQIRLQEARRLMLGEELDAASAGYQVGYETPSYFSRDYKKLFGAPPQRDIAKLRSNIEW